jgi:hypothetical protein
MTKLPETIDFNEADHPGLFSIFHEIDAGIAAIIASDPSLRPRLAARRVRGTARPAGTSRPRRATKKVAA